MKNQRPILLAALSGVFVLFLIWGFLRVKEAQFNSLEEPSPVVVAKKDIFLGTKIDESLLAVVKVPRRFLQPGTLSSFDLILGTVAAAPILKGEQISTTKLVALGAASGLSVRIPQGFRALSVEVDDVSGVAGLIRPNNFVDLLATFEMEDSSDTTQVATYTLVQKILVLAVAEDVGSIVSSEALSKNNPKKNILGGGVFSENLTTQHKRTLTLALTPRQVQEIEFAKMQGKISFALRSQWDEEPLDLNPTTAMEVVGFKGRVPRGYREYRGR